MTPRKTRLQALAAITIGVLALSACGASADGDDNTGPENTGGAAGSWLSVRHDQTPPCAPAPSALTSTLSLPDLNSVHATASAAPHAHVMSLIARRACCGRQGRRNSRVIMRAERAHGASTRGARRAK